MARSTNWRKFEGIPGVTYPAEKRVVARREDRVVQRRAELKNLGPFEDPAGWVLLSDWWQGKFKNWRCAAHWERRYCCADVRRCGNLVYYNERQLNRSWEAFKRRGVNERSNWMSTSEVAEAMGKAESDARAWLVRHKITRRRGYRLHAAMWFRREVMKAIRAWKVEELDEVPAGWMRREEACERCCVTMNHWSAVAKKYKVPSRVVRLRDGDQYRRVKLYSAMDVADTAEALTDARAAVAALI
ncbi:MAG: hypothetical protein Q3986_06480, partial [Akkermansia sp.]|nr:hypothetical protein [Akkermansia sp.]